MNSSEDTWRGSASALKCDLARDVLRYSGELRLGVTGWSMLPTIWPGDILLIKKLDNDSVCEGAIVLFGHDNRLFVHRVVAKAGLPADPLFVTRGDAMPRPDEPVKRAELLGLVACILRDGKFIAPKQRLSFGERIIAVLASRFYWAARILVEMHTMLQREQGISWQN